MSKSVSLFGQELSPEQLKNRVGHLSQVISAREMVYQSGKAKGMRAVEVRNGSGLELTVLPDRGMDISYASYKGIPLSFISKTGEVAPCRLGKDDFHKGFCAGLLTTCGLDNVGPVSENKGESLRLHGSLTLTPAEDFGITQGWEEEEYVLRMKGRMNESALFGTSLTLHRELIFKAGEPAFEVVDTIENTGVCEAAFMLLYHFNFGFPFLSPNLVLTTNCGKPSPRDAAAEPGISEYAIFSDPQPNYHEQVFYFKSVAEASVTLYNVKLGFGVKLEYDGKELPWMAEWKQVGEQDYALGIEPALTRPMGRAEGERTGEMGHLTPGQTKTIRSRLSIEK